MASISKWSWLLISNIFLVLIVLLAFDKLSGREEIINVSLFGIIYTLIRSNFILSWIDIRKIVMALDFDITRIRELLNDEYLEDISAIRLRNQRVYDQTESKIYANAFFVSIIGLICLYQLARILFLSEG